VITGAQVQAARHLLGWSIADLASRSGAGRRMIESFETDELRPDLQFAMQIETALVRGGIEFAHDKVVLDHGMGDDPSMPQHSTDLPSGRDA
jgi:transcriptional regulator with XRE-family HTH domain